MASRTLPSGTLAVRSSASSSSPSGTAGGTGAPVRLSAPVQVTTSVWPVALIASSSSCRSSAPGSRSPTHGSRARTSSPSRVLCRGNAPSSIPSRQTTRWGTERIGTSVQTVSVPVRKLARVGRPASSGASSARTSASPSSAVLPSASSRRSPSALRSCTSCQPASAAGAASDRTASSSSRVHATAVCFPRASARQASSRSTSSQNRPARSMAAESTSSSGVTSSALPSVTAPSSSRSSPSRQVPWSRPPRCQALRCSASKPQRTPAAVVHSRRRSRSSSSKPNRCRTAGVPARSSTCDDVTRAVARSSSSDSTDSSGLVCRSARSARRTRSRAAGCAAASSAPRAKVAAMSGANVSTSGHMTRTSRGSSVGSAASRPRTTSRSTSTWRVRPWQECTCTLRSAGSSGGGLVCTASPARSACSRPSSVGGYGGRSWRTSCASGRTCCSSRTSRDRLTSRGFSSRSAVVSSARRTARGPAATASHSAGEAWCSHRWTSRRSASAASTCSRARESRLVPKTLIRSGRSSSTAPERS